ncbi:MAG: 3-dehydroquinate synthase, partial [Chitinophagaceae bacterium]
DYYFHASFAQLSEIVNRQQTIIITDSNLFQHYKTALEPWKTIVIPAGEQHKQQETVNNIIQQLFDFEADRKTTLVGFGGGVVTDITGYVAAIYMRGLSFGFVPTSVLAMVDASIGGKNGIDVGLLKNMIGVIRQPNFLLFDVSLLQTLPQEEWSNGFAEIIKHACIKDESMFSLLENNSIAYFQENIQALSSLIQRNVLLKTRVVIDDEYEQGDRKLLNFGHTLGHAIENEHQLMHGHAIAIGMVYAAKVSAALKGFPDTDRIIRVLQQYNLPIHIAFSVSKAMHLLKMDKKRVNNAVNYVLLQSLGKANYQQVSFTELESLLNNN